MESIVHCSACGAEFGLAQQFAGRPVKCPFCAAMITAQSEDDAQPIDTVPPLDPQQYAPTEFVEPPSVEGSAADSESRGDSPQGLDHEHQAKLRRSKLVEEDRPSERNPPTESSGTALSWLRNIPSSALAFRRPFLMVKQPRMVRLVLIGRAAGVLLLIVLVAIWWLWTPHVEESPGSLELDWPTAERADAALAIDGDVRKVAKTGTLQYECEAGSHQIAVTWGDGDSLVQAVSLAAGKTSVVRITKPPETVILVDWPEADRESASLEIDGKLVQPPAQSVFKYRCQPGEHLIVGTRPEFEIIHQTITVPKGNQYAFTPVWQLLTALAFTWPEQDRKAATLQVDGNAVELPQTGPIKCYCDPGQRRILAVRPGFKPFSKIVVAEPNKITPVEFAWRSLPPTLATPASSAVLENGMRDRSTTRTWAFKWTALPGARRFHLQVIGPKGDTPVIDKSDLTSSTYNETSHTAVPTDELHGWRWKVRALVAGTWTDWTDERSFDVAPPVKHAIPSPKERAEFYDVLREKYPPDQFDTPQKRLSLANDLLAASEKADGPVERIGMLCMAMDLAKKDGNARLIIDVIQWTDLDFKIDALQLKAKSLMEVAASIEEQKGDKLAARRIIRAVIKENPSVLDEAIASERYQLGIKLAEAVVRAAESPLISFELLGKARRQLRRIQQYYDDWQKVEQALATLKTNPRDGDANLVVGLWRWVWKRDWATALPYLAKADDDQLKAAAVGELDAPRSAGDQLQLADAWLDVAGGGRSETKDGALYRATYWYIKVEEGQSDDLCEKAGGQLARVEKMVARVSDPWREQISELLANRFSFPLKPEQMVVPIVNGLENEIAVQVGYIRSGGKKYKVGVVGRQSKDLSVYRNRGLLLLDVNQDDHFFAVNRDSPECFALNEPFNLWGKVWQVSSVAEDGSSLTLHRSKTAVALKTYPEVGYSAPRFAGAGIDGRPIDLQHEAAQAKYLLLDFWGDWCPYCRKEYPTLRRLNAQYKNQGLKIIGINCDSSADAALRVAAAAGLTYPHLYNGRDWKSGTYGAYRVTGIPRTFLLDKDLRIIATNLRGSQLEARIRELLEGNRRQADPDGGTWLTVAHNH